MKNKIQISIPQPCHENWDEMTISEKGRFCAACSKNIIDFTASSDREIASALHRNGNICGRFDESQLNRDLIFPKEKSSLWIAAASGVFAFLGIGNHSVKAQEQVPTEQTDQNTTEEITTDEELIEISGTVTDEIGKPLSGATITVKGTRREAKTNADGNYSIYAKQGENLVFTFSGLQKQEITVGNSRGIPVRLIADTKQRKRYSLGYVIPSKR